MSLIPKRRVTAKRRTASRANGTSSLGPATAAGKARSAAARLRHGYYSEAEEVVLTALGEDPDEFKRRLDSLIVAHDPANALEMSLVMQMARALWRMERFHHITESMALQRIRQVEKEKSRLQAFALYPLIGKMDRLNALCSVVIRQPELETGINEMSLFDACREDLPSERAQAILRLLLRLRKPGTSFEPGSAAAEMEDIPAAEGEERLAAWREITTELSEQSEEFRKDFMGGTRDELQAWLDRHNILAKIEPEARLLRRGEESSLREVWRIAKLLMSVKQEERRKKHRK